MSNQISFNFNNDEKDWPSQESFPINWKNADRKVLSIVTSDVRESNFLKIATGFTSLGFIIDFAHSTLDFNKIDKVDIVLGFEPERIYRRKKWTITDLEKSIKEHWIRKGISVFKSATVISAIEKIRSGKMDFRLLKRLHAKIYITDQAGMIGSSNFSKNGLTTQIEANFRTVRANDDDGNSLYEGLLQIANNYLKHGIDYNDKIISLLEQLLLIVSWQEALARAIAELLEDKHLNDYPELLKELNGVNLWPSQRMALAQALNIVKENGNVLIAEPTGSGKTRLVSSLRLCLTHWYIESRKKNRLETLIICPKVVEENWENESLELSFISQSQLSMGLLSNSSKRNKKIISRKLNNADLLIIDEAHNFLSQTSKRSQKLEDCLADNIILSTATPINKKAKDLLRLIELLDVDNLEDEELEEYIQLKKSWSISTPEQINRLRSYIWKFTVRRTKKELKKLIDRDQKQYTNRQGIECNFPSLKSVTYKTGESQKDKEIAKKINELLKEIKGVYRLQNLSIPKYVPIADHDRYVIKLFNGAKALAKYNIQSSLRSSKAALLEHIYGTDFARKQFHLDELVKGSSGNIIEKIKNYSYDLPKCKIALELLPGWYTDSRTYQITCQKELRIYQQIGELALELSNNREESKALRLREALSTHSSILAFDSTVITLFLLQKILKKYGVDCYTITGGNRSKENKKVKLFELGSGQTNLIGLCSDSVAEGVNMQQASALFHLDMPSVLRIAEQRVGRLERLDSPHKKVTIYWPDDSAEFALRSDEKLIKTLDVAEALIGANLELPEKLRTIKAKTYIKSFEGSREENEIWDGIEDAYSSVKSLYMGRDKLILEEDYFYLKDIKAEVKCKLSIGVSSARWIFFVLRAIKNRPAKWFFIDDNNQIYTEISQICSLLKIKLRTIDSWEKKWNIRTQNEFDRYLRLLNDYNLEILSPRRRRTLKTVEKILERQVKKERKKLQHEKNVKLLGLISDLLITLRGGEKTKGIDFYEYSDIWYQELKPLLHEKKSKNQYKRKVISLRSLMKDTSIRFGVDVLERIYEQIPYEEDLWTQVSSCIIAMPEENT